MEFESINDQLLEQPISPSKTSLQWFWSIYRTCLKIHFRTFDYKLVFFLAIYCVVMTALTPISNDEQENPGNVNTASRNLYLDPSLIRYFLSDDYIFIPDTPFVRSFGNAINYSRIKYQNSIQENANVSAIFHIVSNNSISHFEDSYYHKDLYHTTLNTLRHFLGDTNRYQISTRSYPRPSFVIDYSFLQHITMAEVFMGYIILSQRFIQWIYQMNEMKVFFLMIINSLPEIVLYICFSLVLFTEMSIIIVLQLYLSVRLQHFPLDTVILFISLFLFALSLIFRSLLVSTFITKKGEFNFYSIFSSIGMIVMTLAIAFVDKIPKYAIVLIALLSPQFSCSLIYHHFAQHERLFGFLSRDKMANVVIFSMNQLLGLQFLNIVINFILFLVGVLMNKRMNGLPPIGWKNIFNKAKWMSLFKKPEIPESNNITFENVRKEYHDKTDVVALDNIDFSMSENEIIVLIGPNGSGKTTMIHSLVGDFPIDEGRIMLGNIDLNYNMRSLYQRLGVVFQEDALFDVLTVKEQIELYGNPEAAEALMRDLDLIRLKDSLCEKLSGGEKRKVCIAMALVREPKILVLDEATSGLDVTTREIIWRTVGALRNTTVLMTTHSLEESEDVSSRLAMITSGKISFTGTGSELRKEYKCGYTINLIGDSTNMEMALDIVQNVYSSASIAEDHDCAIQIPVDLQSGDALEALFIHQQEIGFDSLTIKVDTLESILIRLMQDYEL